MREVWERLWSRKKEVYDFSVGNSEKEREEERDEKGEKRCRVISKELEKRVGM